MIASRSAGGSARVSRSRSSLLRSPQGQGAAEIENSERIFNSIRRQSVLTLHRDYFRLRKLIERRVYDLARKM